MTERTAVALALVVVTAFACKPEGGESGVAATASPSASATSSPAAQLSLRDGDKDVLRRILRAEHRRASADVLPEDAQHQNPLVRRAAVRALARISDDAVVDRLLGSLRDSDLEVVMWAAYGLGYRCREDQAAVVSALAARAIGLSEEPTTEAADRAFAAIARAVGSCSASNSEEVLSSWLRASPPRATAAAIALADVAKQRERLNEDTLVALLGLAAGSASREPLPMALYPFGRLMRVPPSVRPRLMEVVRERLADAEEKARDGGRAVAIRALTHAGSEALPTLVKVVVDEGFSGAERSAAVAALVKNGAESELADALTTVVGAQFKPSAPELLSAHTGPLLALVEALERPGAAKEALEQLATLSAPSQEEPVVRRTSWLRCSAAAVLARENAFDERLTSCDLAPDDRVAVGERAQVRVLDRAPLKGKRAERFIEIAKAGTTRGREAALELTATHPELRGTASLLADALGAKEPGVVASAALALTKQPLLASPDDVRDKALRAMEAIDEEDKDDKQSPSSGGTADKVVLEALLEALPRVAGDAEAQCAVADALGGLGAKEAIEPLQPLCTSSWPVLREHAQRALGLIRGDGTKCEAPVGGGAVPTELEVVEGDLGTARSPRIVFQSPVGELVLSLDAATAPVAVARVVDLVGSGYYEGNVVHRVVPGFVSQFGAPLADGYGGPDGRPALRCETSPNPFAPLTVGVALAGRDTGSSQLFVTHSATPHLDGRYAWVGSATGAWDALVDGDRLTGVKLVDE